MQSMRYLCDWLQKHANNDHYLFSLQDIRGLFPNLSILALKTLLSRMVYTKNLTRVCRGLYLYQNAAPLDGLLLFHAAAHLRRHAFNYISLETVLSDVGIISQIPMQWVSIMSSCRSSIIPCGTFGTIEFIHTNQSPTSIMSQLTYDESRKLWRASVTQALRDMKVTRRDNHLINRDIVHELI